MKKFSNPRDKKNNIFLFPFGAVRTVMLLTALAIFVDSRPLRAAENISYQLTDISSPEAFVLTMTGGPQKTLIGCALFRKRPLSSPHEWISAQFIKNNTWIIVTQHNGGGSGLTKTDLYIGDKRVNRSERNGKHSSFYMQIQDFVLLAAGNDLFADKAKTERLISSKELQRFEPVLAKCLPGTMF